MHLRSLAVALALACLLASPAEARHRRYAPPVPHSGPQTCDTDGRCHDGGAMWEFSSVLPFRGGGAAGGRARHSSGEIVSHPSGCPHVAFCGCGVAVHIFGAPIRALWLAAAWFKYPAASPAPGMVAVRRHHVFAIEQVLGNGLVVAYDPNSGGHLTRRHVRSLAGFRVVNPHGRGA